MEDRGEAAGSPHTHTTAAQLVQGEPKLNIPKYQSTSARTLHRYIFRCSMFNGLVMFSDTFFQTVAEAWLCVCVCQCVCGRVRGGVGVMVFDLL